MKLNRGEIGIIHICNSCAVRDSFIAKNPADSGGESLFCEKCGHFGVGSMMHVVVGDWLTIRPVKYGGA